MIGTRLNQVLVDELAFFVISPEKTMIWQASRINYIWFFRQISLFVIVSSVRRMQLYTLSIYPKHRGGCFFILLTNTVLSFYPTSN